MTKKTIVSGMRATGKMHLGHVLGALKNWVQLQSQYHCFYFVADYHGLFSEFKDSSQLQQHAIDMVRDWLACGLDPEQSTIFVQSDVPQHAELFLMLAPFVPVGWLERSPTYKEQIQQLSGKEVANYGFFGYPVLQTADIILYKGELVPVGEDQVSHLEISREIVRRFNQFYPGVFPEPKALLTEIPKLLGTDNRKMSKSYDNAIQLCWTKEEIETKTVTMITDPKRVRLTDPGHPDECNVFAFHEIFNQNQQEEVRTWCTQATWGCMECKKVLAEKLDEYIAPIRERAATISDDFIRDVLREGATRAGDVAQKTIQQVKTSFQL